MYVSTTVWNVAALFDVKTLVGTLKCDFMEDKLQWITVHAIKKKWENKINADHLHCGDKRLNKGQHGPKS